MRATPPPSLPLRMAALRLRLSAPRCGVGSNRVGELVEHFLVRHLHRIQKRLQRRFTKTVFSGMRPAFIVLANPEINVGLQFL